ncbi:MAG: hypothetical protein WD021_11050 [Rhodothermales bacterium]
MEDFSIELPEPRFWEDYRTWSVADLGAAQRYLDEQLAQLTQRLEITERMYDRVIERREIVTGQENDPEFLSARRDLAKAEDALSVAWMRSFVVSSVLEYRINHPTEKSAPAWPELTGESRSEIAQAMRKSPTTLIATEHLIVAQDIIKGNPNLRKFEDFYEAAAQHKQGAYHQGGAARFGNAIVETLRNHIHWRGFPGFKKAISEAYSKIPKDKTKNLKYLESG